MRKRGSRCIRRGRTSLCLAVSDDADHDEVWLVHDCAKGHAERVPELATLVDRARGLSIDVTGAVICKSVVIYRHHLPIQTHLGKPPGTEKEVIKLLRPSLSRVYRDQKVPSEPSSQRQARRAGAPWPGPTT